MSRSLPAHQDSELRAAIIEERDAAERLHAARSRLRVLIGASIAAGHSYDELACAAVRARTDRAPTIEERGREAARLRQLRRRANARHAELPDLPVPTPANEVPSSARKEGITMAPRLIKRTTVETFEQDDADLHGGDDAADEREEREGDGEGDEPQEPPPPRRRR